MLFRSLHITSEQGLSVAGVNCILKDSRGFMWFGTQEGLNKYDGVNMTVYRHNPDDDNSLSNNFIYYLYEDDKGILWICTYGGGLEAFDRRTNKFTHFRNDPKLKNSISSDMVRCIAKDKDGTYWVGTDDGLNSFDGANNKFTRYLKDNADASSLSGNEVRAIHVDKLGNLWIGTYGGSLSYFSKKIKKFTTYSDVGSDGELKIYGINKIKAIYEDKGEILWIGTDGAGLITLDRKSVV